MDLAELFRLQRELQVDSFGVDPATLEDEERVEFIRWNALALTDELHELLGEVGWKPWATSRHVNEAAAVGEWVDLLHFAVNTLWAVAGVDDEQTLALLVASRYKRKRETNAARQRDGYDGVSSKCRGCKRDLDEAGTQEFEEGQITACAACGCEVISS